MIGEVWVERLCGQAAIIGLPQVWGVQFHPEFSPEVLTDLAGEHPDVLRESGRDPDQVAVETSRWREETGVISRFARLQIKAVS
jgi:GMP synthase-like glutamine amidotransferase